MEPARTLFSLLKKLQKQCDPFARKVQPKIFGPVSCSYSKVLTIVEVKKPYKLFLDFAIKCITLRPKQPRWHWLFTFSAILMHLSSFYIPPNKGG